MKKVCILDNLKMLKQAVDFLVPLGIFLRRVHEEPPFSGWRALILKYIPQTFFFYWLFSLVPHVGTFVYMLFLVPLSAWLHVKEKDIGTRANQFAIVLWYYTVIMVGFGGVWNFIGHTVMADTVASPYYS